MVKKKAYNQHSTTSEKKKSNKKGNGEAAVLSSSAATQLHIADGASSQDLFNSVSDVQKKDNIIIPGNSQDILFIQINRANLVGFFACGLIHPVNYETRELAHSQRTNDAQTHSPDYLILTNGFVDIKSEDQVLIEVVINDYDKKSLIQIYDGVFFLPHALPVSRISKILFSSKQSQANSKASSDTFQDAYLPEHLFAIWDDNLPDYSDKVSQASIKEIPTNKDALFYNKDYFDRVLGMFAFMKNCDLYFTNETNEFANYSDKYLKTLYLINSKFETSEVGQLENSIKPYYQALITPEKFANNELDKIVRSIYAGEVFKKDIFKSILGQPSSEVQNAFNLLANDETVKALDLLDNVKQPELILLAFLFRFRNKDGNDKYAIKDQIAQLIDIKKEPNKAHNRASMVLATLGLYYGYRSLPKSEVINFSDKFYASLGTTYNIKFKLNNFLDRVTIESIYQFCFYGKQFGFEFLPNEFNRSSYVNVPDGYEDKSFSLFETSVLRFSKLQFKKTTLWDWLKKIFSFPGWEVEVLERKDGSQLIKLQNGDTVEYKPYKK
jgi:hypothetical protein